MAKRKIVSLEELAATTELVESAQSGPSMIYVVAAAAFIENALGSLLEKSLISGETTLEMLNNPRGALSSYSARADLCYCLGLLPKQIYQNARTIGDIRNRFAHSHLPIDFDDADVKVRCRKLAMPSLVDERYDPVDMQTAAGGREPNDLESFTLAFRATFAAIVMAASAASPGSPSVPDFSLILLPGPGLVTSPVVVFRE